MLQNDCTVCHLTAASIRKVSFEVCSNCHENLDQNNRPNTPTASVGIAITILIAGISRRG